MKPGHDWMINKFKKNYLAGNGLNVWLMQPVLGLGEDSITPDPGTIE